MSVPANSEIITPAKVLDKCEGGLKSTLDGDQVGEERWLRQKKKDVRLAREFQPKECEHQGQQRSLSSELEELINRSTDDLEDKEIGVLTDLLHEHQDVFATSKNPFSSTSITQQRIVTGEAKHTKQAPRQRTLHLKERAGKEIEKMLAKGIIEPSSSPWSSPVVLVKKENGMTREELRKKQRCNPILSPVIRWLESGRGRSKWKQISSKDLEQIPLWGGGKRFGCTILRAKQSRSPELHTPWGGPWEVTKQVTDIVYRVQKTPKAEKLKFVHHDCLKPFHERNLSSP